MKTAIFVVLTLVKAVAIIYFVAQILKNLSKKNDPTSKRTAFIHFLTMFGILMGLTALEFGITYLMPSDV